MGKMREDLIERKWKEAQTGPEGKLIREMGMTKEEWRNEPSTKNWMKENGYNAEFIEGEKDKT